MHIKSNALAGLSLACLAALPASAQSLSADYSGAIEAPRTEALAFLRIPLGPRIVEPPRFGFGLYSTCSSSLAVSTAADNACSGRPLRALELSNAFGADWTLSLAGAGRRADIGSWSPRTGRLSVGEEGGGDFPWFWLGVGAAAIAVAGALSADDDPLMCSGNTIPNPIAGTCEPLNLN